MKALISLLTVAASAYALLIIVLWFYQGRMVFLAHVPGRALTASPEDIGLSYESVTIATADGERIHGWYVPHSKRGPKRGPKRGQSPFPEHKKGSEPFLEKGSDPFLDPFLNGVVLFFHGNAGNISHRLESISMFWRMGLDVLIVDYRGYGESTGKPSEKGLYRDGKAAWDYLVDERGVAPERIVLFGRSLGAVVAGRVASGNSPAGLIIESGFTSGADMTARLYPFLPARLVTRLEFPLIEFVRQVQCPVLVVHSRDDEIIPFDMGQEIYEALPVQEKTFLEIWGGHNTGFILSEPIYLPALEQFIGRVLGVKRGP